MDRDTAESKMHEKGEEASNSDIVSRNHSDTLYLCNFRVSVDGDWLCLKEVEDQELASEASGSSPRPAEVRQRKPPDSLAITPELERLEKIYPNYPVGNARGRIFSCLFIIFPFSCFEKKRPGFWPSSMFTYLQTFCTFLWPPIVIIPNSILLSER